MTSRVPRQLAQKLAALVLLAGLGGGTYIAQHATDAAQRNEYVQAVAADPGTSPAVKIAMVMGSEYESSGRHIGTPYIDRAGRGQPLTVCNGVTGPEVDARRYYSPADCYQLERARYIQAERDAARLLRHWPTYDAFAQATFIDFVWNKGAAGAGGQHHAREGQPWRPRGRVPGEPPLEPRHRARRVHGTARAAAPRRQQRRNLP